MPVRARSGCVRLCVKSKRFVSSGPLVAARQLGRQFIGIELDAQHHRTSTTRLQEAEELAA